jgi:uncharacterized protein YegP (UPF0339 family)
MAKAPDDAVDRLYGLAREDFIGERDALAKELRTGGRRDEAATVKGLAKPTVAAWAANQAVRSQKRSARELWKAGDQLSAAHDAVLAGKGSGAKLREATERERAAVERLVDAARGLLSASGGDLSEATIERVRETLHAGAIDPDARDEIAGGRTARERAPQGLFGGGADVFAVEAPSRGAKAEPKAKAKAALVDAAPEAAPDAEAAAPKAESAGSTKGFEIFEDNQGEWRWRLVASNGEPVAVSEQGFSSKSGVVRSLDVVRRNTADAEDHSEVATDEKAGKGFEIFEAEAGDWRWRLRASNGELVAVSEQGFSSKSGVVRSLEVVRRNAAAAEGHTEADATETSTDAAPKRSRTKKDA